MTAALVERLPDPGQVCVRCGSRECRSRRHGRPLARGKIIVYLVPTQATTVRVRCPRCGAVNEAVVAPLREARESTENPPLGAFPAPAARTSERTL